ncbi:unnamed protein product [Linum tenue]|uniref:Uncharacterized protein n=1 Tax=Linum tenue TaxID=586396 RepID=A0AAV0JB93_9ROSI|nr:unnamed protein product [Linum tenue]
MGNCCRKSLSSTAVWADDDDSDDWEALGNHHRIVLFDADRAGEEINDDASSDKNRLLPARSSSSSSSGREVKIKVSRRELEELMSRVEMQGLSSEQVLARLIISSAGAAAAGLFSDPADEDHHRHWKPVLQSIPEV